MADLIIPEKQILYVSGLAVPKPANDQNTDDIMPARFLKEITFAKMGEYVYYDERFKDGKPVKEHPFNNPEYSGAKILIAGRNFGCGSSREHAPQGLYRFGIRGIIAESFAEIFAGNWASIGGIGVTVPGEKIKELADLVAQSPKTIIAINVKNKEIIYEPYHEVNSETACTACEISEGRRQAFLKGTWDAMAVLGRNESQIENVRARLPYMYFN